MTAVGERDKMAAVGRVASILHLFSTDFLEALADEMLNDDPPEPELKLVQEQTA